MNSTATADQERKRPILHTLQRRRYSVKSLLLLTLVVALGMAWARVQIIRAERQRHAMQVLIDAGATVESDFKLRGPAAPPAAFDAPVWLRRLIGNDIFRAVRRVKMRRHPIDAETFGYVADLPQLEFLELFTSELQPTSLTCLKELPALKHLSVIGKGLSDDDLKHLAGLIQLEFLQLKTNDLTGSGFEHLRNLTALRWLHLSGCPITDANLFHLRPMTRLQLLQLSGTKVSGTGFQYLETLPHLKRLYLFGNGIQKMPVSDEGLKHLRHLTQLQLLHLDHTLVRGDGLKHLTELPRLYYLRLRGTPLTDVGLKHIASFPQLKMLDITHTQISDEALRDFQEVRPDIGLSPN